MGIKTKISIISFLFLFISNAAIAFAHCPLCTAATGIAVATTRWLGIDDLIVGSFIGAFVISTALWFNNILKKRNKGKNYIPFQSYILVLISLASTVVTFLLSGITNWYYLVFGIDRLTMGTVLGSGMSLFAFWFSKSLIKRMEKTLIPFQTIILTLSFLVLMNIGFYLAGLII